MINTKYTKKKLEENLNKNNNKSQIIEKKIITGTRKSERKTFGPLAKWINKKIGTGTRNIEEKLITRVTNSNINKKSILRLSNSIGKGASANVYKLIVGKKEYIYKSITCKNNGSVDFDKTREYKGLKFQYLLQKYLKDKDELKYLCKLYEYGFINEVDNYNNIYGIMDNCGIELKKYIIELKRTDKLTLEKIIEIMIQCTEALEILHNIGYCHLDIKPENFLVDIIDDKIQIKIIDFGFITKIGNEIKACGTPEYVSPEIWLSKVNNNLFEVSQKNDFFSLGCMFIEFLIILHDGFYNNKYNNLYVCPYNMMETQLSGNKYKMRLKYYKYFVDDLEKYKKIIEILRNDKDTINNILFIIRHLVNPDMEDRFLSCDTIIYYLKKLKNGNNSNNNNSNNNNNNNNNNT